MSTYHCSDISKTLHCALQAVVVGCSDGRLYFLDIASGRQQALVDTAGAIKSPPMVDSWQGWGCLWMASHGKLLLACSSRGEVWSGTFQKHVVHLQTLSIYHAAVLGCPFPSTGMPFSHFRVQVASV